MEIDRAWSDVIGLIGCTVDLSNVYRGILIYIGCFRLREVGDDRKVAKVVSVIEHWSRTPG